jgi:hypothetical protein
MLAGLQDELEGMTAVGGEHKEKGEACILQKRVHVANHGDSVKLTQYVSVVSDVVL